MKQSDIIPVLLTEFHSITKTILKVNLLGQSRSYSWTVKIVIKCQTTQTYQTMFLIAQFFNSFIFIIDS